MISEDFLVGPGAEISLADFAATLFAIVGIVDFRRRQSDDDSSSGEYFVGYRRLKEIRVMQSLEGAASGLSYRVHFEANGEPDPLTRAELDPIAHALAARGWQVVRLTDDGSAGVRRSSYPWPDIYPVGVAASEAFAPPRYPGETMRFDHWLVGHARAGEMSLQEMAEIFYAAAGVTDYQERYSDHRVHGEYFTTRGGSVKISVEWDQDESSELPFGIGFLCYSQAELLTRTEANRIARRLVEQGFTVIRVLDPHSRDELRFPYPWPGA